MIFITSLLIMFTIGAPPRLISCHSASTQLGVYPPVLIPLFSDILRLYTLLQYDCVFIQSLFRAVTLTLALTCDHFLYTGISTFHALSPIWSKQRPRGNHKQTNSQLPRFDLAIRTPRKDLPIPQLQGKDLIIMSLNLGNQCISIGVADR